MHYTPANSIFSGPMTHLPSVYMFDGSPFTCQCEKEIGKADEFHIQRVYWPFLNGIMAFRRVKLVVSMSWVIVEVDFCIQEWGSWVLNVSREGSV